MERVNRWMMRSRNGRRSLIGEKGFWTELKDLDFYVEKEAKKREIEKCYSWEEFMTWRRRYERRRKLLVCTLCRCSCNLVFGEYVRVVRE